MREIKLKSSRSILAEDLLQLWADYMAYCDRQWKETNKINERLRKEYDKKYKKELIGLLWRPDYNPPVMHSIHDNPTFATFIDWLQQSEATNGKQ